MHWDYSTLSQTNRRPLLGRDRLIYDLNLRDIRLVRNIVLDSPLVQLLVGSHQIQLQSDRTGASNKSHDHHQDKSQLISRFIVANKEIWGDDITDLTEDVYECD